MKNILILLSTAGLMASCATTTKTNTAKTMDIYGPGVIHRPILADLEVSPIKITGTATGDESYPLDLIKQNAVSNALKSIRADVLVEPTFEKITDGNRKTATVSGFPATYKGFRPVKQEDIEILKVGQLTVAKVYEPVAVNPPQKKNGWKVLLITVLTLGIGVIVAGLIAGA